MNGFVQWLKGRDLEFLEHVDLGDSFFSAQMY